MEILLAWIERKEREVNEVLLSVSTQQEEEEDMVVVTHDWRRLETWSRGTEVG